MCSYNAVNGIPSCADGFLVWNLAWRSNWWLQLQDILRDQWEFGGYVVSDCGAIDCIQNTHHYTNNPADTCAVAVKAGTGTSQQLSWLIYFISSDLNCGTFYLNLPDAIAKGTLQPSDIARSVKRLFTQRFELGMMDPPDIQPYTKIPPDVVDSHAHEKLALQVGTLLNWNSFK